MNNQIGKDLSLQGAPKQRFAILFLLGLSVFIAFARFHTYNEPIEHDITVAVVIASEMRAGREYYSDLWENKPPGTYIAHMASQALFGYGRGALYALNISLGILTLFGVYAAGTTGAGSRTAGLWAAVFWALASGDMDLQANQPNTEAFMNGPLIWSFALLLNLDSGTTNRKYRFLKTLAIGGLFAIATLYKPHAVFYGLLLSLAHVLFPPERTSAARKAAVNDVLIIAGVGAAAWIAFFAYFALTGRFQILYTTMFVYPGYYSDNLFKNLWVSLGSYLYPKQMQFTTPLVFLTMLGGIVAWLKGIKRPWLLLVAYVLATQLTIAMPGRFYTHYYQLWLPIFAVGAGWSTVLLIHIVKEQYKNWLPHAFATIAMLFMLQAEIWAYRMDPEEWSIRAYGGVYGASEKLAVEIGKILEPGETLFVLGDEPGFYFHTKTRPAVGSFFLQDVASGPLAQELTTRTLNDLSRKPPDLVVIMNSAMGEKTVGPLNAKLGPEHPIRSWISQNYCRVNIDPNELFTICAKPGSSLERRESYQSLRRELGQ